MLNIKKVIKGKGLTVVKVAEMIETTQPHLSNIINGNATPSLEMLDRIAKALNVEVWELFERNGKTIITCPHCGVDIKMNLE